MTTVAASPARRRLGLASRPGVGIRKRLVLVAVVAVFLASVAGGSLLVFLLQLNLQRTATSAASARAGEVAAVVATAGVPDASQAIAKESRSGQFVQIIGPDQRVVGASNRLVAKRPMWLGRIAPGATRVGKLETDGLGENDDWVVVVKAVKVGAANDEVQVAVPVRVQRDTVQTVAAFLLGATPLLLAAVAASVWFLVGRALRPVEEIRQQVASVDAQRLAVRVEVPPTGDEIAALAATMNVMLERLESSSRAQRAFVSDASHELRSPLATLTTAAELAATADEPTRSRLLATISAELTRMSTLVENLMTLARADARNFLARREEVDLDDLLDLEVRRLRQTSSLVVQAQFEPLRVTGDPARLGQALRNLIDNGERHARSALRLTARSDGGSAVVWVDNDGDVVPAEDRERVFERFVRLDESRSRDAGGSGLGLAISRTTVESHGGRLSVVDARDGWCRFEMRLPEASAAAPGSQTPQAVTANEITADAKSQPASTSVAQ